jgi:hypothetical protein
MSDSRDRQHRFVGKFRGKVIENIDPLFQGRIIAEVPAVSGSILNWALPCTPYAGFGVGFYAIPPIGANVWIEYEGGDPNYPVWVGCFWGPEDILHVPEPPLPEIKVFKTEFITMILNDLPEIGGFSLKCMPLAVDVPLTMTFDSTGITILCPESTIKMTPASITITVPESVIEITPETITAAVPASSATMTGEAIAIESPEISITGETNITGVLTVEGETNITPELTVEGDTNIAGALAVEGAVNIAGGIAIEGGGVIDGAPIL